MKKISTSIMMLSLVFLFSCKKDKESVPPFSATGVWKGPITLGPGTTALFINQPDGSSRLYFFDGQTDTSTTTFKFHGTYSVRDNVFYADYTDIAGNGLLGHAETSHISSRIMSGAIFVSAGQSEISVPFEVYKQ